MSLGRRLTLAELRATQLAVLKEVVGFCEAEGIRYYLWAGTLLGAVRHRGFIPWDDDIDIALPRADYERFCRDFPAAAVGLELYEALRWPGYLMPFTKVGDPRSVVIEDSDAAIPIGVNIDVYPIDGWPEGRRARGRHRRLLPLLSALRLAKAVRPRSGRAWHRALVLRVCKTLAIPVSLSTVVRALNRISVRYDPETAEWVGVTVDTPEECVPRSAYGEGIPVEFEGRTFQAPRDCHTVLTTLYGDGYMKEPSSRTSHHALEAFWRDVPARLSSDRASTPTR